MEISQISHLILVVVALLLIFLPSSISTTDPYSQALLSFKSQITDPQNTLHDWVLSSEQNPGVKIEACSWSGVQCDKNSTRVISLDLSMKNLAGFLPGNLFNILADLLYFNISFNSFSGNFPIEIFNLTGLIILDVNRNNFSGKFPIGVSKLKDLVVFDAFSNSFEDQLPVEMSELGNLRVLNLAGSYFNGPIPSRSDNLPGYS